MQSKSETMFKIRRGQRDLTVVQYESVAQAKQALLEEKHKTGLALCKKKVAENEWAVTSSRSLDFLTYLFCNIKRLRAVCSRCFLDLWHVKMACSFSAVSVAWGLALMMLGHTGLGCRRSEYIYNALAQPCLCLELLACSSTLSSWSASSQSC